jgi:hypothetical protein
VKRGRRILLISAALLLACLLTVVLWPKEKEPVYKGKKLSDWVLDQGRTYMVRAEDLTNSPRPSPAWAINTLGTNTLPFLLKWIAYDPPPARRATYHLFKRAGFTAPYESLERSESRAALSVRAFQMLGPKAQPAIPALNHMMTNAASHDSSARARDSLAFIGEPALPYLLTALTNRWPYRYELPHIFGFMALDHVDVRPAIPILIAMLKDTDQLTSIYAAQALAPIVKSGIEPDKILPALIDAVHDPRPKVRLQAVLSLGTLTHARDVTPALIKSMDDPDWEVASMAIRMLAREHPQPDLVIPAIIKRLKPADSVRIRTQLEALAHFGLYARPAVPAILKIMDKPVSPSVFIAASNAVYRIDPQALQE